MFRKLIAKKTLKSAGRFALKREGKVIVVTIATIAAHLLMNRLAESYPKVGFLKQKPTPDS